MNKFNPTLCLANDGKIHELIRVETNVVNWMESLLSYEYHLLDSDFNVLERQPMKFNINENTFTSIKRSMVSYNKNLWCIEDIKLFDFNGKLYGTSNIYYQHHPRIFKVGLVQVDLEKYEIKFVTFLSVPGMGLCEKNWCTYNYNNEHYVVYSMFPLKIYKLNTYTFELTKHHEIDTTPLIKNIDFTNINNYYKNIYYTVCGHPIKVNENKFIILLKRRDADNYYSYYSCIMEINDETVTLNINLKDILYTGLKLYASSIHQRNNNLLLCFGDNDKSNHIKTVKINDILNMTYSKHVFNIN